MNTRNKIIHNFNLNSQNTIINLIHYGWNSNLEELKQKSSFNSFPHGRIGVVHRTCYDVISETGLIQCELTGNLMYGNPDCIPAVGDWVIFQPFDDEKGVVLYVFPRERTLFRRKSGTNNDKQVIASYIDKAFIVQSLDFNFNIRRTERFIAQTLEADIKPVLVLNKSDQNFDRTLIAHSLKHLSSHIPVFFTSIYQPDSIRLLKENIKEGETVIFIGSSGVGKSSLINMLYEVPIFSTSEISKSTGKGKHTSTRREMILLKSSGILIDTPGVREFGLTVDEPLKLAELLDISAYAGSCHFKDCKHINEPDCAVLEAVKNGLMDQKVYNNYLKLRNEALHFQTAVHEKRRKEKSFSKHVRQVKKRQ